MPAAHPTVAYEPGREYRRSFLLLRWLLIILAAYLTLFNYLQEPWFAAVCAFVAVFALTNVACIFLPPEFFMLKRTRRAIAVVDVLFVASTFYLLRDPNTYLYVAFILVFVLAVIWRDLKVVAFSLIAVSLLYGMFSSVRLAETGVFPTFLGVALEMGDDIEPFLTLSLIFVVSIFYFYLCDRFRKDAELAAAVHEEKRRAEVMLEITRSISSSLNSQEILHLIVTRLCETFGATDCSIVRLDPKTKKLANILAKWTEVTVKDSTIELERYPELQESNDTRQLLFLPEVVRDGLQQSVVVVPMLAQDNVLGLIYIRLQGWTALREADERFFNVMSLTAANALRNAQLFEDTERRARTDFLTDLPNHGFFQSTLSGELRRAQRHNRPLSLLMIDLDLLKEVNDRFGHPTGDMVIRAVGETIRSTCRDFDFAARYGGEEYTVILPETPLTGAIQAAERVRERIASMAFIGIGNITASIGISNYPVNALGKEDLIRVADQALYVAKSKGRDCVEYFN